MEGLYRLRHPQAPARGGRLPEPAGPGGQALLRGRVLPGGEVALRKNFRGYRTLCEADFPWEPGREYRLDFTAQGDKLTLAVDGRELLSFQDPEPLLSGCAGISVEGGSHCLYRDLAIAGR